MNIKSPYSLLWIGRDPFLFGKLEEICASLGSCRLQHADRWDDAIAWVAQKDGNPQDPQPENFDLVLLDLETPPLQATAPLDAVWNGNLTPALHAQKNSEANANAAAPGKSRELGGPGGGSAVTRAWLSHAPHLPLVVCVRGVSEQLGIEAVEAGAQDYLPLDQMSAPEIVRTLRSVLARRAHAPEIAQARAENAELVRLTEALRAGEARMRAIIESEPECVKVVSVDGRLLDMNPAGLNMIEAPDSAQVLNQPIGELIHPEDRDAFFDLHTRVCNGESGELQFRIITFRGNQRWVETHSTPLRNAQGETVSVLSVTRDVTVRRWTEQVLLRIAHTVSRPIDDQFFQQLLLDATDILSASGALIGLHDPDQPGMVTTRTFVYQGRVEENISYIKSGTPCAEVLLGEGRVYEDNLQAMFPDDPMLLDYGIRSYVGAPLVDQQGKIIGLLAMFRDREIRHPELMLSSLQILAGRVSSELERQDAYARFIASQRQAQLILRAAAEGILGLDAEGYITFENPAAAQSLGWEEGTLTGNQTYAILRKDGPGISYPIEACPIYQTLQDGQVRRIAEDRFTCKDGTVLPVEYICSPILDDAGTISGSVISFRDVSERHYNEQLLAAERNIFEAISDKRSFTEVLNLIASSVELLCPDSMASIVLIDGDGETRCLGKVFGPSLPQAYSEAISGLPIGPRAGSCGTAAYLQKQVIVADIQHDPLWEPYRELAGRHGLAACWSTPIFSAEGEVPATFALYYREPRGPQPRELESVAHMAHLTGIAMGRHQEQIALEASEERFRRAFQEAAISMSVTDLEGRFVQVNDACCRMLGYSQPEMLEMDFVAITHPDDRELSLEKARGLRAGEYSSYTIEKRYFAKAGHIVWTRISVAGLRNAQGELWGQIALGEDVTRRIDAERELQHSQALLRTAARIARFGGWAIDLADMTQTWSEEVRAIHGVPEGFDPSIEAGLEFYAPECRPIIERAFRKCMEEGIPYDLELPFITAQGRRIWVRTTGEPVSNATGKRVRIQGAFQDITAAKIAEESLLESEERFRLLAKATNDAIWDWDLTTDLIWWNEGFETLFGYSRDEIAPDSRSWSDHLHPDDREQVESELNRIIESATETHWQQEYRFMRKDGSVAYVLDRGFLIRNDAGDAVRMVGGMTDLTEQKKLESQILRAQRMESLGVLAGGIAHDLNNMLTPIMLSAFLLKKRIHDEQALHQLAVLEETATRGAEMVRQILAFARGGEGRQLPLDVGQIVREVAKFMQETLEKNITIELDGPQTPWAVLGDPTQIHQVLVNLCVNARDAMPKGGKLLIGYENRYLDAQYSSMIPQAKPGPYVRLTVSDTGVGIDNSLLDRIFDPFFTTKDPSQGTGLGLATVQGIVKGHGGFVTVYSEAGHGATFRVYLPARDVPVVPSLAVNKSQMPRGDGELILVIDDEKPLRTMTAQTLETFGYRVVLAEDGAEAVSIYASRAQEIALVLTDMMMPVMDGFATIQALRKINPNVSIIAASGLAATGMAGKAARAGVEHFLSKPFTADSVVRMVAQVLGKK